MGLEKLVGPIPNEWEYTTLGEACMSGGGNIQTGPFGSQLHAVDYVPVGIPSIMPQNIGDNRIHEAGIARITPEDAKRLSRYLVEVGDIVYSRRGDVERRALIRTHEEGWLCGTGCLRVRLGKQGPDPHYTAYYLGHPNVRKWIVRHAHGATMSNLNTAILSACPFLIPPINQQRTIAYILGTLDDKIELNRRMSQTLEAMARALYQSWFVDFDGVPPEDMQESELGPIPKGWRVGHIYDISSVRYGAPFASSAFNTVGVGLPLVRIRDLRSERPKVWTSEVHPKGYLIQPGDIIVGMDGEFRAYLWGGEPSWMNQRICAFHPKEPHSAAFLYNVITPHLARIEATEVATTVIHLGKNDIDGFHSVIPPVRVAEQFGVICQPFYDKIVMLKQESARLVKVRDTLLPKLISGELRVDDRFFIKESAA